MFSAIFLIIFLVIILTGIQKCPPSIQGFLDYEFSTGIRGIMAIAIILHHMAQIFGEPFSNKAILFFFISLVGPFYMLSGYGLAQNLMTKKNYLHGFIKKRIGKLAFPFLAAFVSEAIWAVSSTGGYHRGILTAVFIRTGWFVKSMVIIYLIWFLLFKVIKDYKRACSGMFLFLIVYVLVCIFCGVSAVWYGDIFAFELGLCVGFKKEYIYDKLQKHLNLYMGLLSFTVVCCWIYTQVLLEYVHIPGMGTFAWMLGSVAYSFLWVCVSISHRFKKKNHLLVRLGDISYELYMMGETCGVAFQAVTLMNLPIMAKQILVFGLILLFAMAIHMFSPEMMIRRKKMSS